MTQVRLWYLRVDGENPNGELLTKGKVTITPLTRWSTPEGLMTTDVHTAALGDAITLGTGPYKFAVETPTQRFDEYRMVPATGGPYRIDELGLFNPNTGTTSAPPQWKAYVDTRLTDLELGAVTPETIQGATELGQGLLVAASEENARGLIGAGTASTKADVGLGNVANLAPENLPISNATADALDGKQPANDDLTEIATQGLPAILSTRAPQTGIVWGTAENYPGLDKTGVSDSSAALQQWLDDIPDNGVGELEAGVYRARSLATSGKSMHLRVKNARWVQATNNTILFVTGGWDAFIAVTTADTVDVTDAGGTAPRARLTLASAPSWEQGDIVKVISDDKIPEARPGEDGVSEKRLGEFLTVDTVVGNVVTMTGNFRDTGYATNIRVARMLDHTCTIDRWVSETPAAQMGSWNAAQIQFSSLRNPTIGEVQIKRGGGQGVVFRSCFGYQINSADIRNLKNDTGLGQYGYGILDMQSESGRVLGYVAKNVRHAFTDDTSWTTVNGTDPAAYGRSRNAEIHGVAYGTRGGAWDTHGAGVGHRLHVQAYGCPVGLQFRGKGHKAYNLVVRESTKGVWVFDEPDAATNMTHGHELINPDISGVRHGVHVEKLALDTTRTSLTIRGGRITAATSPLLGNFGMFKLQGNPVFSFTAATTVGVKALDLFDSRVEVIDLATADMRDVGSTGGNTRAVRLNDNDCRIVGEGTLQVLTAGAQTRNTVAVLGTASDEGICQIRIRGDRSFSTNVFSTCTTTSWSDYQIGTGPWQRLAHNGTTFVVSGVEVQVATPVNAADAVNKAYADTKVDKSSLGFFPKDFGAVGDGVADDAPAWDSLVAALNGAGNFLASANKPLSVTVPAGTYNLRAGGIRALVVSNVTVNNDPWSVFILKNGPIWTLGNSSTIIENFMMIGGQPKTLTSDTLASLGATCVPVYAVNAARIYVDKLRLTRSQLFKGVSNLSLSTIYLRDCTGSGLPDRDWIEIDTSANSSSGAAGLFVINCGGYAYVPPTNPTFHPKLITGATQANPVVITSTSHGFATGAKVRLGGITGMTQLNGNDYTITSINANTFSLNGVDGTAFGAYTGPSGFAAELLWTHAYGDAAVLSIKGHWDTVVMDGGLYQHWPWLWRVDAYGPVSFVFDEEVTWDFGGSGRFHFTLNGGSISSVKQNGGWHFCFNDDYLKILAPGSGFVTDLTIRGLRLGMSGKSFIDDNLGKIVNLTIDGMNVMGCGRARIGTSYLVKAGATGNNNTTIRNIVMENAGGYFVNPQWMKPDVGLKLPNGLRFAVENNEIEALTTNYDIPIATSSAAGQRRIRSNRCRVTGVRPEYLTTGSITAPTSDTAQTNHSGMDQHVFLSGGTMTAVKRNGTTVMTGSGPFNFIVPPDDTWSVTYSVAPTVVVSYQD